MILRLIISFHQVRGSSWPALSDMTTIGIPRCTQQSAATSDPKLFQPLTATTSGFARSNADQNVCRSWAFAGYWSVASEKRETLRYRAGESAAPHESYPLADHSMPVIANLSTTAFSRAWW